MEIKKKLKKKLKKKKKIYIFFIVLTLLTITLILSTGAHKNVYNKIQQTISPQTQSLDLHKGTFLGEEVNDKDYYELLVKTTDNCFTNNCSNKKDWTPEMIAKERAGNSKQGYIITYKEAGWNWGNLETDPKRFAIVKINKSDFNESWLEPEYINPKNESEGILTERKYRFPLDEFMNESEINDLKNIKYNEYVNWEIRKDIENISSKIEYNDWNTREPEINLHGSSGVFEICVTNASGECNYSSLATWESGEEADLTGNGPCIANITENFTESSAIVILGWTTTASDYIQIITAEGTSARHQGKWDESAYVLNTSGASTTPLSLQEPYTRTEGLQIISILGYNAIVVYNIPAGEIYISHNIVTTQPGVGGANDRAIRFATDEDAGGTVKGYIYNNIFYGFKGASTNAGIYLTDLGLDENIEVYIYNNQIIDNYHGINNDFNGAGSRIVLLKNNLVFNNTDDYEGTFHADSTNNTYSEGADPGSNGLDISGDLATPNDIFVDWFGRDFHLNTSGPCIDTGIDLSSDGNLSFSDDIDSETRTGTWDIGADEYVSGVPSDDPPVSILSYPADNNKTEQGVVTFECNATDDFQLLNVTHWIWNSTGDLINKSSQTWNGISNSTTFTFNFTFDNSTTWNCEVYDNASQCDWGVNRTLEIITSGVADSTAPNVTITQPTNVTYNQNNISINFTVQDETAVSNCEYSFNSGLTNLTLTNTGDYWYVINDSIVDGGYVITAFCNDTSNNWNITENVTFSIDGTFPALTIVFPINSSNTTLFDYNINYTVSDLNLDSCWWYDVAGGSNTIIPCGNNITGPWVEGENIVTVYANDSVNNINSSVVSFRVDTRPPSFDNLANQSIYQNQSLLYDINATDDGIGIIDCFTVNNTGNFSISCNGTLQNITGLQNQDYWLNISVNDTLNNLNSSIIIINVTTSVIPDSTPPNVTINRPQNRTYNQNNMSFAITVYEETAMGNCVYSLNLGLNNYSMVNISVLWNASNESIADGGYIVSFYCNDSSNNWNRTENVTFSVDGTPPDLIILPPTGLYGYSEIHMNVTTNENTSYCEFTTSEPYVMTKFNSTFFTNYTVFAEGNQLVTFKCNDTHGNMNDSESIYIGVDLTFPAITISSPINSSNTTETGIDINYTVSDTNLESCWWTNDTGLTNKTITCNSNITGQTWDLGINTIHIYANDSTIYPNHINFTHVTFNVTAVDTASPTYTNEIESPPEPVEYGPDKIYNFNITWNDDIAIETSIIEWNGTNHTLIDSGSGVYNFTIQDLGYGNYSYYYWANDTTGNVNMTSIYSYNVSVNTTYSLSLTELPSGTWTEVYPTNTNVTGIGCPSQINCTLWLNISGYLPLISDNKTFGVGKYLYNYTTTGNRNYTNYNAWQELIITQNSSLVYTYLNHTRTNVTIDNGTSIWLNGSLERGEGKITLYNNETSINVGNNISNLTTFNLVGLYNITVIYEATQNYTANSETWWLNVTALVIEDSTSPNVTITQPTNVTYNQNNISINFTVQDETAVSNCEYSFDSGLNNLSMNNIGNYWFDINDSIVDGGYTITALCNDTSNNWNITENITFSIYTPDSTSPNVTINSPLNQTYNQNNITFNVTAIDETAMDSCLYSLDSGLNNYTMSNVGSIFNATNSSMNEGSHTVIYFCNDTLNNINNTENVTFFIDTLPPVFTDGTPYNSTLNNNMTTIQDINATDAGIGLQSFVINDTTHFSIDTTTGMITNITTLAIQTYWVNISVNDSLGWINSSVVIFNITNGTAPDITPPTFDNLRNFTHTVNTSFSESITATDTSGIDSYVLNDTSFFNINRTTGLILNATEMTTLGIYYLNLTVNDTIGNFAEGFFYINVTTAPTITYSSGILTIVLVTPEGDDELNIPIIDM